MYIRVILKQVLIKKSIILDTLKSECKKIKNCQDRNFLK